MGWCSRGTEDVVKEKGKELYLLPDAGEMEGLVQEVEEVVRDETVNQVGRVAQPTQRLPQGMLHEFGNRTCRVAV